MMIQMQIKQNETKEDAAATVIQKHMRRYSAKKKVERRRSQSFSSTNAIALRMQANKTKSRKKEIADTMQSFVKQVWKILQYFAAFAGIIIFGGLMFSVFEYENAKSSIESDIVGLAKFEAYFEHNETVLAYIRANARVLDAKERKNNWDVGSSTFYAFTIATTIGYGVFSPTTVGGQIFTIIYALLAIPIGTSCIVAIAEMALYGFTVLYSMTLNRLDIAFDNLDTDGGGFLDHDELREGLIALDVKINEEEFQHVLSVIDEDGDQQIDRTEFKTAVHLLHADLSRVSARGAEVKILLVTLFVWLGLGTLIFCLVEEWTFIEGIYFTMVTLTTIGLGDYAPDTNGGRAVLYVFTFVGIGLVATLIHLVGDMAEKAEHEAHIKMAEARAKMMHRKRKGKEESNEQNTKVRV